MPQLLLTIATVVGVSWLVKVTTVERLQAQGRPWGLLLLWLVLFSASLLTWLKSILN
jgi:hypothetical protein